MATQSVLNPWPARWPIGSRPNVVRYPLTAGQTFNAGALVVLTSGEVVECGADPASILGIATEPAADVIEAGYTQVYIADDPTIFAIQGTSDPVAANIGEDYGVVKTDGVWYLDITDTTNVRALVVDIDTTRNIFFVKFLEANRQLG